MLEFVNRSQTSLSRKIYEQTEFVDPRRYEFLSRYSRTRRIDDTVNGVRYHETYNVKNIPTTNSDRYVTVDRHNENRIDVISFEMYGSSLYWWVIALANNIVDPFIIPLGSILRIPQISSLYSEGSVLE